jgi:hypothetical protein
MNDDCGSRHICVSSHEYVFFFFFCFFFFWFINDYLHFWLCLWNGTTLTNGPTACGCHSSGAWDAYASRAVGMFLFFYFFCCFMEWLFRIRLWKPRYDEHPAIPHTRGSCEWRSHDFGPSCKPQKVISSSIYLRISVSLKVRMKCRDCRVVWDSGGLYN